MIKRALTVGKSAVITGATVAVIGVMLAPESAHAGYLDPGSGSTAVQWIVAGLASLGRLKRQISDTVSKIFGK